jgi:hypothetical protein
MARNAILQIRRDTEEGWGLSNFVLNAGEFGFESDNNRLKIGDGATPWNDLDYVSGGGFTVSPEPPEDAEVGEAWVDSDTGWFYIYFDGEWVEIGATGPAGLIISDTPPDKTDVLWYDTTESGDAAVPIGGTTGQALVKTSDSDYDLEWKTVSVPFNSGNNIIANQIFS